MNRAETEQKSI